MRRPSTTVARVAAVAVGGLLLGACSGGDPGPGTIPPATAAPAPSETTRPTRPSPTTTSPATITQPGANLAERVDAIEVSARWSALAVVLSATADESLAQVAIPTGDPARTRMTARCSPVDGLAPSVTEGLVVRVIPPALDRSTGGLDGFELVASEGVAGLVPGDTTSAGQLTDAVAIRFEVDGESRTSVRATVVVDEDPTTGSFRGELADGSVIEGAYRCG